MMLSQEEAENLLRMLKEATRKEILSWSSPSRNDEVVVSVGDSELQFILSLTRNPFEVKMHFRTKSKSIHLARVDTQRQHINPDGMRITGPHLHWYKEGYVNLEWAEPIDWYDASKPMDTLGRFLELIETRFPRGIQEVLI